MMVGGASAGLAYSFVGRRLQRLTSIGDYLAGVIAAIGFIVPTFVPLFLLLEPTVHGSPVSKVYLWVSLAFCTLLEGVFIGHYLLRDSGTSRVA
jgi:hypothetical protein